MTEIFIGFLAGVLVGLAVGLGWQRQRATGGDRRRRFELVPLSMPTITSARTRPQGSSLPAIWDLHLTTFAFHGNMSGFSRGRMTDDGLVSRTGWETYVDLLRAVTVITDQERARTRWTGGWNYPAFRMALKYGHLRPPYPDTEPPPVNSAHNVVPDDPAQPRLPRWPR